MGSVVMGLLGNLVKSSVDGVVIELDKGNIPYIVGEKVTGSVHITTQKDDVKVAKIILEVSGTLSTSVTQYVKRKKSKKKETFTNNETFFTQSIIIEGTEKILPVGNSKYKFEFQLPEDGRGSFHSEAMILF